MLRKLFVSVLFTSITLVCFAQRTCETAISYTDSMVLEPSSEVTWLKIAPSSSSSFSLISDLKDFSYIVYHGSESFCSGIKHPASIFSANGKIESSNMEEASKTGKCLCNTCITAVPHIGDDKSYSFIKIMPHTATVKVIKNVQEDSHQENGPAPDSLRKDIKPGTKVAVTNILFQPNSSVFLPESKQPLEILYIFLKRNPGIKVEIQGHVNVPGPQMPEDQILSEQRAKAIFDYLVKQGIPKAQISYKGFGNQFMLYPKPKNQFQMMMNRRVEILILENKDFTK